MSYNIDYTSFDDTKPMIKLKYLLKYMSDMRQSSDEILNSYRAYLLAEKKSPQTVKQYVFVARSFLAYVSKPIENICLEDVERYKIHLVIEKNYSRNSLYLATKALKSFLRYIKKDFAGEISSPKRSRKLPVYLAEDEVKSLLLKSKENTRDFAIISLLAYTGIRVSELCNLNIDDIDFFEGLIRIRSGKGDKDRVVVIGEEVLLSLRDYMKVRKPVKGGDSAALFTSNRGRRITPRQVERIIKKYAREAGINKNVTPHVLRHTFATTMLKNGADIRFIQTLLGHSSISTTEIYTHINRRTLKDAYFKFKPNY